MMFSVPHRYQRTTHVKLPKLDGCSGFIDKWIEDDLSRKRQKRHTTKRVLKWLRAEHVFPGGYSPKKNEDREHGRRNQEMFYLCQCPLPCPS